MAHRFYDLVQQVTSSTGTAGLTLGAAAALDRRTFAAASAAAGHGSGNGDTFWVLIYNADNLSEYEISLATYSSAGPSITRSQVQASSNAGALVNFSAGTNKVVSLVAPATKTPLADNNGNFVFPGPIIVANGVLEPVGAPAITAGALSLDLAAYSIFAVALNANVTSTTFANMTAGYGRAFTLQFTADGTPRTFAEPGSVVPLNGTYTPSSVNGKRDLLSYYTLDGGTTWLRLIVAQNF